MRKQGLADDSLQVSFNSAICNRILYALSASDWGGYLSSDSINHLDANFEKAVWWKLRTTTRFEELLTV